VDSALGVPERSSHDWVDHQLLAALQADAVDTLVTEDVRIHRRAKRLGLHHRVAFLTEALTELEALSDKPQGSLPAVETTKAHNLDSDDEIFIMVRQEYPEFDKWLTKCKREHRQAWIVRGPDNKYAGVSIVNREDRADLGLPDKTLKICMFKISDRHAGHRYGELLLRDIFNYAEQNAFQSLFVEVFPKQERLIAFLNEFGFFDLAKPTSRGELRLGKALQFTADEVAKLDPLEFNRRFGPSAIKWSDVSAFVVPIKPKYHDVLFRRQRRKLSFLKVIDRAVMRFGKHTFAILCPGSFRRDQFSRFTGLKMFKQLRLSVSWKKPLYQIALLKSRDSSEKERYTLSAKLSGYVKKTYWLFYSAKRVFSVSHWVSTNFCEIGLSPRLRNRLPNSILARANGYTVSSRSSSRD